MIFLLRHGETAAEGQRRFIGWTDLPLTDGGRRQARRCGRELASGRIASIWCSDLLRAKETAEIISRRIGVPIRSTTALREIHLGAWEGLEMAEVRRCDPEAWRLRGDRLPDFRPPGGESFRDLADRVLPEFASIAAAGDTDILVVGHAGVNRVILCSVLGMPMENLFRIAQPPCAIAVIDMQRPPFRLLALRTAPEQTLGSK